MFAYQIPIHYITVLYSIFALKLLIGLVNAYERLEQVEGNYMFLSADATKLHYYNCMAFSIIGFFSNLKIIASGKHSIYYNT